MVKMKSFSVYSYLGFGIIAIVLLSGFVLLSYQPKPNEEEALVTLHIEEDNSAQTFTATLSREKLFSEERVTLNFSPVSSSSAVESIDCDISCKKTTK